MPMQYTDIFKVVKNENFQYNVFCSLLIFAQKSIVGTQCEYPQYMFWSKNKKSRYTPVLLYKIGYNGVYVTRICY